LNFFLKCVSRDESRGRAGAPIASHDGLERELKFFNRLEGGVCTTCAPRDQEISIKG
jgi:hypothetical protein